MNSVKVIGDKLSVKLPVKNNKITLKTVKAYFPHATGLIYIDKNEKCGLLVNNDECELVPGITEYHVHNTNPLKDTNYNDAKKRKINDIMAVINGKENQDSVCEDPPEYRVCRTQLWQSNQITPKKITKKTLYISWKHRMDWNEKSYKQMKAPIGGIRKLELVQSTDYSYAEIRTLSINAMRNQYNQVTFENSLIQLANNEEEVFDDFTTTRRKPCTFWEFSSQLKLKNSQLRLCLLTTAQIHDDSIKGNSSTADATSKRLSLNHSQVSGSKIHFSSKQEGSSRVIITSQDSKNVKNTDMNRNERNEFMHSTSHKQSAPSVSGNHEVLQLNVPTINKSDIKFTNTVLGRGAFGSVILSTWLGTDVAVKKLKCSQNLKYLLREISVMDKIRHPNIISIMAISHTDEFFYIVMEYFDSVSLRNFIRNPPVMLQYEERINKKAYISQQICRAVSYLHESNPSILHKDLKPENILIDRYLTVKICDLGLSKIAGMSPSLETTVGSHFHGTPIYMPPEILIHVQQGDTSSDVWSMACCVVEVFTEKKIWQVIPYSLPGLRKVVLQEKKPDLEDIPIELRDDLSACFNHDPTERPRAYVLLEAFNRFLKTKEKC